MLKAKDALNLGWDVDANPWQASRVIFISGYGFSLTFVARAT
jgi:hypothetical protein